ncbi:MAG: urease accessory protein UreF, partial [Aurantimonas coralicida]
QSEAVRILRRLEPDIRVLAERAGGSTLDDLGSAALGSDIAALRHETLPTRLFRS